MTFDNKKIKKTISSLLIIFIIAPAIFLSFPTKKSEAAIPAAVPTADILNTAAHHTNTANTIKEWALQVAKELAMRAARNLINKLTQATINWINSGFHGNPLYLENPKSFFKDIAKTEIKYLVNTFGYDSRRFPFGKQFALNIINSYGQTLENNAQYTLSKVINDPVLLQQYRTDFSVGGWNGFLMNTQYPQNNYIGFQMLATEELARRLEGTVQNKAQKVQTALQQGQGFLSPQICLSNPKYNNLKNEFQRPTFQTTLDYNDGMPKREDYGGDYEYGNAVMEHMDNFDRKVANEKGVWQMENTCPDGLVATTPGSVVANQIMTAMSSKYRQNELAATMGNSLAAIFDALINKFFDKATGGLRGLNNRPVEVDSSRNMTGGINQNTTFDPNSPLPGEGGGQCGTPLPLPPGTPPNMLGVVQQVARDFSDYLTNSCQDSGGNWNFMDEVVNRLHSQDPNWGYNGKRGDTGNLSQDAISYSTGADIRSVHIIDIIVGHCGSSPQPAWQDVTSESYSCGAPGAYVYPR